MTKASDLSDTKLPIGEFVAMSALIMALIALSIDAILPVMSTIAKDFHLQREQDIQLLIPAMFLGMALGQPIFGPLSDSLGRKVASYWGFIIFGIGCLLSIKTQSFSVMIFARIIQGFGLSGPRTINLALIRDQYQGPEMARVSSYIMAAFIMAPALAPMIGQGIITLGDWRLIFWFIILVAVIAAAWFSIRQPETLATDMRTKFRPLTIYEGMKKVLRERASMHYTLAQGFIVGAFIGYISSVQPILQGLYQLGSKFPLVFASFALSVGASSIANSFLVRRYSMKTIVTTCLLTQGSLSLVFVLSQQFGMASLPVFMVYMLTILFCVGMLFGNLTALAMLPLGKMAGMGAAIVGFISTIISVILGTIITSAYDHTLVPLSAGFMILAFASYFLVRTAPKIE